MKRILLYFACFMLLVACSDGDVTPQVQVNSAQESAENTPTPNPPTATATEQVRDAAVSPTIEVIQRNIKVTATPSPMAPATLRPTRVPPTPKPTREPVQLSTAQEILAAGRSRFTGDYPEEPENLERRPILCKISNSPKEMVRPQSGLNSADIIFEHMTEGTITRFSAIFQSKTPPDIGPVRSARLIDLQLAPMHDATLCFSGASIGVTKLLEEPEFRSRLVRSWYPGYYRTGEDKPFEHTFYADMTGLWGQLEAYERNYAPVIRSQVSFDTTPPADGTETDYASVNYIKWTFVEWQWDTVQEKWLRWADDEMILDKNTGDQVSADNVIIVFAVHGRDESICAHQMNEDCLMGSTLIELWDRGFGYILRDGMRYAVEWRRDGDAHMLTYFDRQTGEAIPLQVGNSWVQVVPTTFVDLVEFKSGDEAQLRSEYFRSLRNGSRIH